MHRRHSRGYVVINGKAYEKGGRSHRHKHRDSLSRSRGFRNEPALSREDLARRKFKHQSTSEELTREKGYSQGYRNFRKKGNKDYAPKAQAVNNQLYGGLALRKRRGEFR